MALALLWLHLELGGENIPPLRNQSPKIVPVTFDRHLNATRVNILRPTHKLDASPYGRDAGILEPNPEPCGLHLPSPPLASGADALAPWYSAAAWVSILSSPSRLPTAARL